jgi:hypothetical protein
MVDFMICHQNLKILYGNGHIFFIQQSKLDKDKWNVMDECHCFFILLRPINNWVISTLMKINY